MKQLCARLLVIAVLGVMLASTGCIYSNSDIVATEKVCVTVHEVQTTGTFTTFVVSDEFKTQLEALLKEYNEDKKNVKSIHMVDASYKVKSYKPHDWKITALIDIARQDVPEGAYEDGPAPFVKFYKASLKDLKGDKVEPKLCEDGVKIVNRALKSLLNDEDPRLVMNINCETVSPEPSPSDPMEFTVDVCVKFQIVIKGHNHGGGGHGGGGHR
jgi:hypothetical protein